MWRGIREIGLISVHFIFALCSLGSAVLRAGGGSQVRPVRGGGWAAFKGLGSGFALGLAPGYFEVEWGEEIDVGDVAIRPLEVFGLGLGLKCLTFVDKHGEALRS